MPTPNGTILIFEDDPLKSDNKLFLALLRKEVSSGGVRVRLEKTVRGFERRLRDSLCKVIILDIIAATPMDFRVAESGSSRRVDPTRTGVELLQRIRAGHYGDHCKLTDVFMRSARGEPHIVALCMRSGATGYFQPGAQDLALIDRIKETLGS